jgi:hypothetical protein
MKDGSAKGSGSGGASPSLYRMAELLAAPPDTPVFIVEGKGNADCLAELGFVATTDVGEASEWRPENSEPLRGRAVVIIADNEKSGLERARKIAVAVEGVAASIKIVTLPGLRPGHSVAAWFEGSRTRDDLEEVVEETPERQPTPDAGALLAEVSTVLKRFVVFPSRHHAPAVALWVAHTHVIDAADATPYLAITSPEKQSGKTRLQELLELLVARPWRAVLPSEAVVFRKIAADRPTLLLDEVDAIFDDKGKKHEGLRALLNAGHRRGATVPRCVGEGVEIEVINFDVFGPKAIAGIGALPDTVADRSIPIRLARRAPDETVEPFRRREIAPQAKPLRERLERWAESAIETLRAARPGAPGSLSDRAVDGWEPLFAIADAAGGDWPRLARDAAVALHGEALTQDDSTGVMLLGAIRKAFEDRGEDRISTSELVAALVNQGEGPWVDWWEQKVANKNTKGPGAQLSRLLSRYGISSKPIRVGSNVWKGYELADFKEAFSRYLPDGPKKVTKLRRATRSDTTRLLPDRDPMGELLSKKARNLVTSSGPREEGEANGEGGGRVNKAARPGIIERLRKQIEAGADEVDAGWDYSDYWDQ